MCFFYSFVIFFLSLFKKKTDVAEDLGLGPNNAGGADMKKKNKEIKKKVILHRIIEKLLLLLLVLLAI